MADPSQQAKLAPFIDKIAFVDAINDAWALVVVLTIATLVAVPLARRAPKTGTANR